MCIVNNCHGAVVGNDQLITRAGDGNGGRDRIDHGPRGHDDLVNAVRGVLAMHGAPTARGHALDRATAEPVAGGGRRGGSDSDRDDGVAGRVEGVAVVRAKRRDHTTCGAFRRAIGPDKRALLTAPLN
jgi:hypothetical protein